MSEPTQLLEVTSGDVTGGNFFEIVGIGSPGDPNFRAKLYWYIADDPKAPVRQPITLTVQSLEQGGDARHVETVDRHFTSSAGPAWPTSLPLPHVGKWRIIAETAEAHGCFEFTLHA